MKRFIPLLFTAILFVSCEKEPNLDKLINNYVVYTQFDKGANFSKDSTFFIPDSILVITDNKSAKPTYLERQVSNYLINAYSSHMATRGYHREFDKSKATYGLQVSFIENTYYFSAGNPWWSTYPWYWSPSYWWPWYTGSWYYPYPFIYSHTAGSLVCEMVDISSVSKSGGTSKPTIIWNNYITDIGSITFNNEGKVAKAIDQAFTQSPYIKYTGF